MCDEFMKNDRNFALLLLTNLGLSYYRESARCFFCNQCFVFLLFQSHVPLHNSRCSFFVRQFSIVCSGMEYWSIGVCVIVSTFSHLLLNSFSSFIAFSFSVHSSSLFYEVIIHSPSLALCIIHLLGQFWLFYMTDSCMHGNIFPSCFAFSVYIFYVILQLLVTFSMLSSLPDMTFVSFACTGVHTHRQRIASQKTILMPMNESRNQISHFLLQCNGVFFCCLAFWSHEQSILIHLQY